MLTINKQIAQEAAKYLNQHTNSESWCLGEDNKTREYLVAYAADAPGTEEKKTYVRDKLSDSSAQNKYQQKVAKHDTTFRNTLNSAGVALGIREAFWNKFSQLRDFKMPEENLQVVHVNKESTEYKQEQYIAQEPYFFKPQLAVNARGRVRLQFASGLQNVNKMRDNLKEPLQTTITRVLQAQYTISSPYRLLGLAMQLPTTVTKDDLETLKNALAGSESFTAWDVQTNQLVFNGKNKPYELAGIIIPYSGDSENVIDDPYFIKLAPKLHAYQSAVENFSASLNTQDLVVEHAGNALISDIKKQMLNNPKRIDELTGYLNQSKMVLANPNDAKLRNDYLKSANAMIKQRCSKVNTAARMFMFAGAVCLTLGVAAMIAMPLLPPSYIAVAIGVELCSFGAGLLTSVASMSLFASKRLLSTPIGDKMREFDAEVQQHSTARV